MQVNISHDLVKSINKTLLSYSAVIIVGICLLIIGIYVDRLNSNANLQKSYNNLLSKATLVRARIESNINSNTQVVKGLVAAISIEPGMSQERFIALSNPLLSGLSQIRNIAAAPDMIIRYMNPVKGNEAAIGLDYRTIPDQYETVNLARDTGSLIMAGPVTLVQGGQGFIARIPVFLEPADGQPKEFWGVISSVINIDKFFTGSGLYDNTIDFDIAIVGNITPDKKDQLIYGEKKLFEMNPVLTDILLPYGKWTMAAVPKGGWKQNVESSANFRMYLLGIAIPILIPLLILGRYTTKKRENEEFLKLLFKLSPVGIALNDYKTGAFIEVNDVLLENTGYKADEFYKLSYWDITPEDYKEEETRQLELLEETGQYGPYEKEYIRKDGSRFPVVLNGLKILDTSGKKVIWSFIEDISKRKQAEQSLQRSQKMDAIGQLTGGIAHDFNNIMGIILGNIDLVKRDVCINPEKAIDRINNIDKASQRASELTKQLLSFSKKKPSKQSATNINNLIKKMQNLVSRSITPEINVSLHLEDDLWLTNINQGDFEDSILNLCINSRDAMDGRGQLIISTHNRIIGNDFCETNTHARPGKYIEIAAKDTGVGISEESMDRIFEPFYTTKGEGKGTGLGLSMVYGFAERCNGFIIVKTKENIGTTIKLFLPRIDAPEQPVIKSVDNNIIPASAGSEIILVVDDEVMLLELAKTLLEELGYKVITATSGKQALDILQHEPAINMIFSDVVMPGDINGFELAEKAAHDYPGIKILLTSGNSGKASTSISNVPVSISENILGKPYTKDELAVRIRRLLDIT